MFGQTLAEHRSGERGSYVLSSDGRGRQGLLHLHPLDIVHLAGCLRTHARQRRSIVSSCCNTARTSMLEGLGNRWNCTDVHARRGGAGKRKGLHLTNVREAERRRRCDHSNGILFEISASGGAVQLLRQRCAVLVGSGVFLTAANPGRHFESKQRCMQEILQWLFYIRQLGACMPRLIMHACALNLVSQPSQVLARCWGSLVAVPSFFMDGRDLVDALLRLPGLVVGVQYRLLAICNGLGLVLGPAQLATAHDQEPALFLATLQQSRGVGEG